MEGNLLLLSSSKQLLEAAANGKKNFRQALDEKRLLPFMSVSSSMLAYVSSSTLASTAKLPFVLPADMVLELDGVTGKLYCNLLASVGTPLPLPADLLDSVPAGGREALPDEKLAEQPPKPAAAKPQASEKLEGRVLLKTKVGSKQYELRQQKGVVTLSENGKQQWQYSADGEVLAAAIISPYKKDEAYALLNTSGSIYLVDTKGKNAVGFPVRLKSKATNGIAVFDYSNTRDYRIFVACKDGKVYLFDKQGKTVEGWSLPTTKAEVSRPVEFFRVGGKDYLVVADKNELYILDRKGSVRVTPSEKVALAASSDIKVLDAPARLLVTDTKGKQATVSLVSGKVVRK